MATTQTISRQDRELAIAVSESIAQATQHQVPAEGKSLPKGGPRAARSTKQQVSERIEWVAGLIISHHTRGEIKRLAYGRYGVRPRTSGGYISAARLLLAGEVEASIDLRFERAISIAFYASILASDETTMSDKLAARARLDVIKGLVSLRR